MASGKSNPNTSELFDRAFQHINAVRKETAKVIIGQDEVIDQALITLISGGHILLIGVPGLAKTLLVETLARVMGLESNRVQCTPDLMPADILGSEVLEETAKGQRGFRFIEGPIFTQFFMADEINRASPRTQSALLQAMQEKEVSVSGVPQKLPVPFHVLATQNPIEQEGTYPLPEAQLDRFLMQIDVTYPDYEAEREIVLSTTNNTPAEAKAVMCADDLLGIQALVRDMPAGEQVVNMIVDLVRALRPGETAHRLVNEYVSWPPGPRASQSLMLAARARALLQQRCAPLEEDVIALAVPVLRHRMALNFRAQTQQVGLEDLIEQVIQDL